MYAHKYNEMCVYLIAYQIDKTIRSLVVKIHFSLLVYIYNFINVSVPFSVIYKLYKYLYQYIS